MDWRILYVISLEMLYIPSRKTRKLNSPPPKPEVILTNFFAEPTVLLVPITSRDNRKNINTCIFGQRSQRAIIDFLSSFEMCVVWCAQFILSYFKELTSWVKLQVEIFCKASRWRALQKICTCSLTHDVSSLEDDNVFVFCVAFFQCSCSILSSV